MSENLEGKTVYIPIPSPVSFLEWVSSEKYMRLSKDVGHKWFSIGMSETYTTEELYELFLKEIPVIELPGIEDKITEVVREHLDNLEIHKWWDYGDFEDIRDKDACAWDISKSVMGIFQNKKS